MSIAFPVIEVTGNDFEITHIANLGTLLSLHGEQLYVNHGVKTLHEMAKQGGLGWIEILAILEDRIVNPNDSQLHAKATVTNLLADHNARIQTEIETEVVMRQHFDQSEQTRRLALRPRYLTVFAHCKDLCTVTLTSGQNETIVEYDGYVPRGLGIGGGDDVELTIDLNNGMIVGWKSPSKKALRNFIRESTK